MLVCNMCVLWSDNGVYYMKFSPSSNSEHLDIITKSNSMGLVLKSDEELVESLKSLPEEINFDVPDADFNTILYLAAANNYTQDTSNCEFYATQVFRSQNI